MAKILISLTYFEPNISGVTVYAKRLAEGLVSLGHEVTILTSHYQKQLPLEENRNGLRIVRSPVLARLGKGVLMPFFPFTAYRLIKEVDSVNCHLPQFEALFLAFWAKLLGKKLILTHHTDLSGWPGLWNHLAEGVTNLSQFFTCLLADKIVTYTKDYADHSAFLSHFKKKLVFIYPPITVVRPDREYKEKLARKLAKVDYRIGFSGRIARQKGIPILLKAIPFLKESLSGSFKIIFAGPKEIIGEDFMKEITPLIRLYRQYLLFLGPLSQEKLASFYQIIDLLVLPSDDTLESFGLVQVEAMLFGKPVVAPNLPGVRVPVKETIQGKIFLVGDFRDLAAKISQVLKNRQRFKARPEVAEKIFSYQKTLRQYQELLAPFSDKYEQTLLGN